MSGAPEACDSPPREGLFAVAKVPLAEQLGPNLRIGIGAHDLAVNDHVRLIGQLPRNGRARQQRNAQGRQDQLGME
jgi:hypothetical protein